MGGSRALRQRATCRSSRARTASTRWSRRSARSPTRSTRSTRSASGTRRSSRRAPPPTPTFTAFRGFEWTSDRFGHINVYFSQQRHEREGRRRLRDDGHVLDSWLTRAPALGGGGDGLAIFNHPGGEEARRPRPGLQLERLRLRARPRTTAWSASRSSTTRDDFGAGKCGTPRRARQGLARRRDRRRGPRPPAHRRLGRSGLGQDRDPRRRPLRARRSRRRCWRGASTRSARPGVRLDLHGRRRSRWARASRRARRAARSTVKASVNDPTAKLELVTSGGKVVAQRDRGSSRVTPQRRRRPSATTSCARVARRQADRLLEPGVGRRRAATRRRRRRVARRRPARAHVLLARRLLPARTTTTPGRRSSTRSALTVSAALPRGERARPRLPRDHRPQRRALGQPTRTSAAHGVIGIPGYENSLRGHAQMLGARTHLRQGRQLRGGGERDGRRAARRRRRLPDQPPGRRHRAAASTAAPTPACSTGRYGYDVRPDTIEVWNSSTSSIRFAEAYWRVLARARRPRSARPAAATRTGRRPSLIQGVGNPTTWVLARRPHARRRRSRRSARAARRSRACRRRRAARRSCSRPTPTATAPSSRRSATRSRPARRCACARAAAPLAGIVRVRANGKTIVDKQPLAPGGERDLQGAEGRPARLGARGADRRPGRSTLPDTCEGPDGVPRVCPNDFGIVALTSPVWLKGAS